MAKPPWAGAALDEDVSLVLGRAWHSHPVGRGVPVRFRASGGSAVLRGPWLLRAALRLPPRHALLGNGPAAAARWFGEIHLRWLRQHGVGNATLYEGPSIDHWSCFAGRGPGEVLAAGRKIVGIAQAWQRHGALLESATLLAPPPWGLLCELMGHPASEASVLEGLAVDAQHCCRRAPDAPAWAASLRTALMSTITTTAFGQPPVGGTR